MRSYEQRKHQAFSIIVNDEIVEINFYETDNPSKFFLEQLDNPNAIHSRARFLSFN